MGPACVVKRDNVYLHVLYTHCQNKIFNNCNMHSIAFILIPIKHSSLHYNSLLHSKIRVFWPSSTKMAFYYLIWDSTWKKKICQLIFSFCIHVHFSFENSSFSLSLYLNVNNMYLVRNLQQHSISRTKYFWKLRPTVNTFSTCTYIHVAEYWY